MSRDPFFVLRFEDGVKIAQRKKHPEDQIYTTQRIAKDCFTDTGVSFPDCNKFEPFILSNRLDD